MAVRFYDKAVYDKIQSWIKDKNMKILKVNETSRLFQTLADENKDEPIQLPIIVLSRDTDLTIENTSKKPMSFDGYTLKSVDGGVLKVNAIPIIISYQLDIYTKEYDVGDEYNRNFIFNLINFPKLDIIIPYNGVEYHHTGNIVLNPTVQDNSDIPQRIFPGQFTRWTISFTIEDAYLFSVANKDNVHICAIDSDIELM